MRADGLAIRLWPAELAEDRVGFLLVNLDELLDRHVPAFRGHQEMLAVRYSQPRVSFSDRDGYLPTTPDAPESWGPGGAKKN